VAVCIEFFFPIGWRTYLLKKSAKGLHYFGLDCGMLEYERAVIQRTIVDFPAFLEHGSAEKIAVCGAHTNRDPNKHEVEFNFK
jgi:hypothetical protein